MSRVIAVRVAPIAGIELIVIWSGAIAAIPSGWVLETRVEDLFLRSPGTFDGADLLTTGGVDEVTLSHVHTWPTGLAVKYADAEHDHTHPIDLFPASATAGAPLNGVPGAFTRDTMGPHAHPTVIGTSYPTEDNRNEHRHFFVGTTDGNSFTFDNRPPYYALAYIRGQAELPVGAIAYYARPAATLSALGSSGGTTLAVGVGVSFGFDEWLVADPAPYDPPFLVTVGDEDVYVNELEDGDPLRWGLRRGWNGTTPASHPFGSVLSYPKYTVCNGQNGTPNLYNGFVFGADGVDYLTGEPYGTNGNYPRPVAPHPLDALTVATVTHPHTIVAGVSPGTGLEVTVPSSVSVLGPAQLSHHTHNIGGTSAGLAGDHTHAITEETAGPNETWASNFAPVPRYVRLYCIQRLG